MRGPQFFFNEGVIAGRAITQLHKWLGHDRDPDARVAEGSHGNMIVDDPFVAGTQEAMNNFHLRVKRYVLLPEIFIEQFLKCMHSRLLMYLQAVARAQALCIRSAKILEDFQRCAGMVERVKVEAPHLVVQ